MGILQEKRAAYVQPEIKETPYGAEYVRAAVETPVDESAAAAVEEAVSEETRPSVARKPASAARKKSGRPKKGQ